MRSALTRRDETSYDWPDKYSFCEYRCRVHSRSTSHENDYIERSHRHCFSEASAVAMCQSPVQGTSSSRMSTYPVTYPQFLSRVLARATSTAAHEWRLTQRADSAQEARPRDPEGEGPALPKGAMVVVGKYARDCAEACRPRKYSTGGMASVNTCNVLREYFECEAGCEPSAHAWGPGYVSENAPRGGDPGMCFIKQVEGVVFDLHSGNATGSTATRLCVCE